jgi:hypothetical protein
MVKAMPGFVGFRTWYFAQNSVYADRKVPRKPPQLISSNIRGMRDIRTRKNSKEAATYEL